MHPFANYVLRTYYKETGWNDDNLYANLTRSSNAILDFVPPRGLNLTVSQSPNALFRTSYSMNFLPSLNGSVGYIFTSCDLNVKTSRTVQFKDMIDHFKVYDQPRKSASRPSILQDGRNRFTRDYLMYGRFYLPTGRLDALYSSRLTPNLQALVAAISDRTVKTPGSYKRGDINSNVMLSLQHDVGKWCTEYTWSAEDEMWGVRVLHNFGSIGASNVESTNAIVKNGPADPESKAFSKRVDEEDPIEGGLKGRVSAGAEFYFSAKEKSAGVSTGIRFTTLPDATPPSFQVPGPNSGPLPMASKGITPQSPTTITAQFNPMMGHISGAYSARVSRDLSLASRFDFNVYSFESEWTMGLEWWIRRSSLKLPAPQTLDEIPVLDQGTPPPPIPQDEVHGVVKARASTNNDISLMWEGRLRNMLVSLGVVSDLSCRSKPIKAIGLDLSYFSSG